MHRSILIALAAIVLPLSARAAGPDWHGWDEGLRLAAATGRPVIVDVYTDWCGWCRRMDHDVYSRPAVSDYLRSRYVTIRINAESNTAARYEGRATTYEELAQRFRVSGYPTTIFLRSTGAHMANVPGYLPPDQFLLLLRYVAEGHADRNEPFAEFQRSQSGRP
jgi:thioredoxin-related protein